ncbi:MAG TPA: trypsin-like peptidase domain-containing protein [Streptosporangiaceae bacterium]|nr:trypsin-like peptidase domain-containing protein [Streptosporangiaceae bacterium]
MGTLTGPQSKQLRDSLARAFNERTFEIFLWEELGQRLDSLAPSNEPFTGRVYHVIRAAGESDWERDLIVAALAQRPKNQALLNLAAKLGLIENAGGTAGLPGPDTEQQPLQRFIIESSGLGDPAVWHARMGYLLRQVGRVEVPLDAGGTLTGTGFLVASDLVLTNYHVVADVRAGAARPEAVRVRFDHVVGPDELVPNQGTAIALAQRWLAAWRPPSEVDLSPHPGAHLPGRDELDFAFLRLAASQPGRGRVRLARPAQPGGPGAGTVAGDWLIILQHPGDEPLKQAFGLSLGQNANQTRLRYKITTDRGSSGAPVLNERLELVGLHHAGDPNFEQWHTPEYNAAVPVAALLDYLEARESALVRELVG